MSNLLAFAHAELPLAGHDLDGPVARDVLALIKLFASQGHSGMSASFTRGLFLELARHRPIGDIQTYTATRCVAERLTASGEAVDTYVDSIVRSAQDLVEVFLTQIHDDAGATQTVDLFALLADFKPASPLTGHDDEWADVSRGYGNDETPGTTWQNKRCFNVFKDKTGVYNSEGRIFREPAGDCYTNGDSRVFITFPYIPTVEYVDVPADR